MRLNITCSTPACAMILPSLIACVLPGCSNEGDPDSSRIDASAQPDAAPAADADPSCVGWELQNVDIASLELVDVTPVHPQRTARLRVRALHCPGDDPAIVQSAPTLENEFLIVSAHVFRRRGVAACAEPEVVERMLEVKFFYPGSWKVVGAAETVVVSVVSAPAASCGQTVDGCALDCDCEGDARCLSFSDGGTPTNTCARPCELDRDCRGDGQCKALASGLDRVCDSTAAECTDTRPCPGGFGCEAGRCEPEFVLNGLTRHACSCDAECDSPLRCVWAFGNPEGRCDVICPTTSSGWCEGPHVCGPGGVESGSASVCAWVGD